MKQLPTVSFMQTFGIILVVLGHSFYSMPADNLVLRWIYGFHMPLFFFISGYLLRYVHPDAGEMRLWGRGGYLTRKARRLLVPYVVISSIFFVPKAWLSKYTVRPLPLSLESYLDQLLYPYHNVFGAYWFLPTLFLIFVLFTLGAKIIGKNRVGEQSGILIPIFIALNILIAFDHDSLLNWKGVLFYTVYFYLGWVYRSRRRDKWRPSAAPKIAVATFIVSIATLFVPSFTGLDFIVAVNGIFLTIALAKIYERQGYTFLNHLYGHTFHIYLYSGFFQIACLQVLLHFVPLPPIVYIPLATIAGIYGPRLFIKFDI